MTNQIIQDIQIVKEGNEKLFLEKVKEMSSRGYEIISTQYFQDEEYKFIDSHIATMAKYQPVTVLRAGVNKTVNW